MLCVGLDIYGNQITMSVLDENGKRMKRLQVSTVVELEPRLRSLSDRFEVCYEASCGYGFDHDAPRPLAARVVVAHPGQLRLIFRSKHKIDRNDAEKLATLLFPGEAPAVHVPSVDARAWRELISCRRRPVEKRTVAKNGIQTLLRSLCLPAANAQRLRGSCVANMPSCCESRSPKGRWHSFECVDARQRRRALPQKPRRL